MATLSVRIDPTDARSGARQVVRSLDDVKRAATGVERSVDRFGRVANDNLSRVSRQANITAGAMSKLRNVAIGLAAAFSARAILQYADAYTRLTNSLRVTGVAASAMAEVEDRLFAAANRNGVEIEALSTLYSRASIASKELGASQSQLLQFVDGVTAALRVQGGSTQAASGALLQLSQALGSGIVRAEEFSSILEGAFPIAQAAARGIDGMGGSVARLRAAIVDGEITSREFFEGLLKGFTATEAQAAGMSLTVGNAMTVLRNSITRLIGTVDSAFGASAGLSSAIAAVGRAIDGMARGFDVLIANIDRLAEVAATAGVYLGIAFGSTILGSVVSLTAAISRGLVSAVWALNAAMLANPMVAFTAAITAAVVAAYYFRDEIRQAIGIDVVQIAKDGANLIINSFRAAFADVEFVWQNFPAIIGTAVTGAVNVVIRGVNAMIDTAVEGLNSLVSSVNSVLGALGMEGIGKFSGIKIDEWVSKGTRDLEKAAEEHKKLIHDIMNTDVIGDFGKRFAGAFRTAEDATKDLNDQLGTLPPTLKDAGKAAKDAAKEFEAFQRTAERLAEEMFPGHAAAAEAEELIRLLEKYRSELSDIERIAVEGRIDEMFEASRLGVRELADEADSAFKDMAKSVEQTLGQALGDLFTKPAEDLDDFLDDVMRGFARMASQNIAGMFDGLFSGGTPDAANDNARQTKLLAKELGKATAVGSAEGTRTGFLSALGNLGGAGAQGGGGTRGGLLASLGGAGVGYSTQSPVMGALGGAVSGFASGGFFGAILGGIGGLLGGIFGKSQAEKQADIARQEKKDAAQDAIRTNRGAIDDLVNTGFGRAVGDLRSTFNSFMDQAKEYGMVARKAGNQNKLEKEIFASIDKYEKVLRKDFARGFGGTIRALEAGFGPNSPFVQARSSIASLGEEMRKFVDDTDWATNGTKKLNKARNAAQEFLLSQFSGPDSMSPMEAEMERLKGVKAGLKQALKDLGMTGKEAGKAIRDAMKDAKSALGKDYTAGLTASVREISGQGYLNEMLAVDQRFDERLRDIKALKLGSGATRLAVDELTMSLADIALTSGLTSKELMTFGASLGLSKSHLKDAVKDMAALSKAREQEAARISAQQAAAEKAAAKAAELDRFRDLSLSLTRITTDTSTLSGALKVLNAERALEIRRARDAGESARNITLMERALAAERQQIINQFNRAKIDDAKSAFDEAFAAFTSFADGIRDFRNSLKLDTNYSTLSASEQLSEARSQFEDIASRAMKGDRQAMEQLTGSAQTYLDQARSYYSSTQGYADIYDTVMGALRQAETSARGQITEAEKQLAANQKLVSGLDTVSGNLVSLATATKDLTAAVRAYRNAGGSYSGFSTGGYTGDMPIGRVAGVVHGQEFVAHAAATARWRPQLEAMNAGTYRPAVVAGGNDRENFRELGKAFIGATSSSTTAIVGAINEMSARVARLEAATKQAAHEQAKISRKAG